MAKCLGLSHRSIGHKLANKILHTSLIQANIPQQLKWDPNYLDTTLQTYDSLTKQHWSSDLIVWPEAALPIPVSDAQAILQPLARSAQSNHSGILLGAIDYADTPGHFHTGLLGIGTASGYYHKHHLVPFGEYVPLDRWLRGIINFLAIPMSNFVAGDQHQALIKLGNITIAPFVCYEIAYTDTLWHSLPKAQLLVTVSNDAWFNDSFALAQHLQIAQFRARQSGRYLLFSTNDGITAIIEPQGHIQAQLPIHQRAVLNAKIYAMSGATPWSYWGDWPILLLIFAVTLMLVADTDRRVYP